MAYPWCVMLVPTMEGKRQVTSDDRTPDGLLAARNHAEQQIQQLLAVVADNWSVKRYDGFDVNYKTESGTTEPVWCFASLWDWSAKGGYIHVSPYRPGENVRTADFEDLIWREKQSPPLYRAAAAAYRKLKPVQVLGSTERQ